MLVVPDEIHGLGKGSVEHLEIDESCTGYRRRFAEILNFQLIKDGGRHFTWILLQCLSGYHRRIGLKIPKACVGSRSHNRQRIVDSFGTQCGGKAIAECGGERHERREGRNLRPES